MTEKTLSVVTGKADFDGAHALKRGASGESRPPILTGGVNSHIPLSAVKGELGVDWLAGSFPAEHVDAVSLLMVNLFGTAEALDYGFYGYDQSFVFHPFEARILFDSPDNRSAVFHGGRAVLQLPAAALMALSSHTIRDLIADLVLDYSFKCTRIDICFDDFERIITPRELKPICDAENFAGFNVYEHKAPRRRGGIYEGDSLCFGRRGQNGSGKYLRFYDKELESDGEVCSVRWEVEFSKDKALNVCCGLAFSTTYDEWCSRLGALIGGAIDFVDRSSGEKNLSRLPRLDFWARIIDSLGSFRIRGEKPVKTVEGVDAWVKRSVASSLKMLRSAYGSDFDGWLDAVLDDAVLSVRHSKIVHEFHKQHEGVGF